MRFTIGQRPLLAGAALAATLTLTPLAAQRAPERVDYEAIYRPRRRAFNDRR